MAAEWVADCVAGLQLQAAAILMVGVAGWTVSGLARRQEMLRERSGALTAAAAQRRSSGDHARRRAKDSPWRCSP